MIQERELSTWEQFVEHLAELRSRAQSTGQPLLFRGQSNKEWGLRTSLDRYNREEMLFSDYYRVISEIKTKIETLTNTAWPIPDYPAIEKLVGDYDGFSLDLTFGKNPAYEYMAYLPHHGFPSPLLDWTQSPFVAAYFAFADAIDTEAVSIYVLTQPKISDGGSGIARIHRFGPNVRVHRRHVLQQSEYTMCLVFNTDREWRFSNYNEALSGSQMVNGMQLNFDVQRFTIPSTERQTVLRALDEHNLNAFSLLGSEESLMQTLAFRTLSYSG